MMDIVKEIGLSAVLGQLAEECAELAQAALKLQRIEEGKNPTPVTREDAAANLLEEGSDVELCMQILNSSGLKTWDPDIAVSKQRRWEDRIKRSRGTVYATNQPDDDRKIVTEVCPHCEMEVELIWDVEESGYKAHCPYCGHRLMLCDECLHRGPDGTYCGDCDYDMTEDTCRFNQKEE